MFYLQVNRDRQGNSKFASNRLFYLHRSVIALRIRLFYLHADQVLWR